MNKEIPTFSERRLNEVIAAFKKRSKAIKHKNCEIEFTKEFDQGYERLNVDCYKLDTPQIQIRISLWDDGAMFFRTCQGAKKGWKFNIQFYGKAFDITAENIVANFENGLNMKKEKELIALWKDISPYKE